MKKREMDLDETPGELLRAQLKALGITQTALASRLGRSNGGYLSEVMSGKRGITERLALDLERELGIPAQRLLYLQVDYNLERERRELQSLAGGREPGLERHQRAQMRPAALEEEARKRKEKYARPRREKTQASGVTE